MAKDLFSRQAGEYARFRPGYPPELYEFLLSFVPDRDHAWDAGTGNGQAAIELARHFRNVTATDLSSEQISKAAKQPNITYYACPADNTPIAPASVDLITVAQAYHWFPFDSFAEEVRRVSRPEAIIAVWTYQLPVIHDTTLNDRLIDFYINRTGAYWDSERRYVDDRYASIPFPYRRLSDRNFNMFYDWTPAQMAGYLRSWSAVQHIMRESNLDPVQPFYESLLDRWPEGELKRIGFPITLIVGKVSG
jgi:SAM-dependent methyltransferase